MLDKRIVFEDEYVTEEYGTITYYFVGPKELLKEFMNKEYPEVEAFTISVECPINKQEGRYAEVEMSPVYEGSDYDWSDIDLPYEEVDALIALAHKSRKEV